jgi:pimeloyl-ACP methyl ester carboxylesterase
VHYFDLLGYGRSEKRPGQDVSLGIQNRVFAALLDHWRLDAPDVVAHDFGGSTALRTHLLDGRDYRSLTLIDPVALGPWGSPFVQVARHHGDAFTALPAYIHEALLRAYVGNAVHRELTDDELRLYLEPWLGETGQPAFYRQLAQMSDRFTDEVEHRYGEIRCPVSILWGAEDTWIPVDRGEALAARIPGAAFRVVPEASHLVQEDAPEAIVATVLDFLR